MTASDVRAIAMALPRTSEALVRECVKFRIGRIVYLALSPDETILGFAYPKEERAALVASDPDRFLLPSGGDLRYNWVHARLALLSGEELHDIVVEAWRMCVPKKVAAEYDGD